MSSQDELQSFSFLQHPAESSQAYSQSANGSKLSRSSSAKSQSYARMKELSSQEDRDLHATPMDVDNDEVCWICLEDNKEDQKLQSFCKCPRKAHPQCLARWQLQQAGRAEETQCRFCGQTLADWKDSLTPAELKPEVEKVQPIMVVYFDGEIHRIPVRQGDDGLKEFTTRIRELFKLPPEVDISLTFGCKEPMSGHHLKLEGMGAFDAAVHCASVAAAERQHKASLRQNQGRTTDNESDEGEDTTDLLQSTLGAPLPPRAMQRSNPTPVPAITTTDTNNTPAAPALPARRPPSARNVQHDPSLPPRPAWNQRRPTQYAGETDSNSYSRHTRHSLRARTSNNSQFRETLSDVDTPGLTIAQRRAMYEQMSVNNNNSTSINSRPASRAMGNTAEGTQETTTVTAALPGSNGGAGNACVENGANPAWSPMFYPQPEFTPRTSPSLSRRPPAGQLAAFGTNPRASNPTTPQQPSSVAGVADVYRSRAMPDIPGPDASETASPGQSLGGATGSPSAGDKRSRTNNRMNYDVPPNVISRSKLDQVLSFFGIRPPAQYTLGSSVQMDD